MLKTVFDNIGKKSNGRIGRLFLAAIGLVGGSYSAYYAYDAIQDADVKSRVRKISQSQIHKQYDSVRVKDVELIREILSRKPDEIDDMFSVVIGPPGIGKTVAIESAAENLKGSI